MFRYLILLIAVAVYAEDDSKMLSEEEKKQFMLFAQPVVDKCLEEFKLSKDDLMEAHKTKNIDKIDSCFFACCFKGHNLIDEEGIYSPEESHKIIDMFVKNDAVKEKLKKIGETCLSVNEKPVSDGNKGCDRAKLLMQCYVENKKMLS